MQSRLAKLILLLATLSSSMLLTGYGISNSPENRFPNKLDVNIAKTPDEREPEAVKKAINQLPKAQNNSPGNPPPRRVSQRINSPLRSAKKPPKNEVDNDRGNNSPPPRNNRPQKNPPPPRQEQVSQRPSQEKPDRKRPPQGGNNQPKPPRNRPGNQPANSDNSNNQEPIATNNTSSRTPTFRSIDYSNVQFGILAPGDFQDGKRYYHFYQFDGRENELVQLRLIGSKDNRRKNNLSLEPCLLLLDPDNQVIAQRCSVETKAGVREAFLYNRLPKLGKYTIAITSRIPGEKGRYSLALRNDRASYFLDEASELGDRSLKLQTNGNYYDISKFKGKENQLISIRADSVFEDFSPYIVLLDSQGNIVAADNAQDGRYSALIDRARLPKDDTYYVVVISAFPQEKGNYRLTVF
ncbi:PPC domain-containing protein [Calothrix sp. 336/3]|uniref:PPC domain-containing protein n=1 Tax=Calothrix sp. 336/3 TaxID=1337936 RepID=UPI0004E38E43|nr:PPC domain-containing protein [Calothrix sp. 336/3]AKG22470.1 hypothetical protein IJ00_15415 [Calothrix sp. 336/3]